MKNGDNEFMQHDLRLPELTVRGMILGAVLTIIFTASNVYLGLKVGLTFSSAIPAAITRLIAVYKRCTSCPLTSQARFNGCRRASAKASSA